MQSKIFWESFVIVVSIVYSSVLSRKYQFGSNIVGDIIMTIALMLVILFTLYVVDLALNYEYKKRKIRKRTAEET